MNTFARIAALGSCLMVLSGCVQAGGYVYSERFDGVILEGPAYDVPIYREPVYIDPPPVVVIDRAPRYRDYDPYLRDRRDRRDRRRDRYLERRYRDRYYRY